MKLEIAYLHTLGLSESDLRKILDDQSHISQHSPAKNPRYFFSWLGKSLPDMYMSYDTFLAQIEKYKILVTIEWDSDYPESLLHIGTPPLLLYIRGNIRKDLPKFAVVGSRESTPYGESIVTAFTPSLVQAGYSIVSGGALGIDAESHRVTLDTGGHTIAVVGCGVDIFYPARHRSLYERILANGGAIVSQFPLSVEARPYMFPMRNEIIAGLSIGVMVVEAREKSGSLITARLALEQGKDVFIPPSDIGRQNSWGTLRFLQGWGAKLVLGPEDILVEYGMIQKTHRDTPQIQEMDLSGCTPLESSLLISLATPSDPDTLAEMLGIDISEVLGTLSVLEITGRIIRRSDSRYERT